MKVLPFLIFPAAAFAVGLWLGLKPTQHTSKPGAVSRSDSGESSRAEDRPPILHGIQIETNEQLGRLLGALKNPDGLESRHELWEAMRGLELDEVLALFERAEKLPLSYRRPLMAALLERWLELDLEGARKWLLTHYPDRELLSTWARKDPEAALADAMSGRVANWDSEAVIAMVKEIVGPNVREQVLRIAQFPPSGLRYEALAGSGAFGHKFTRGIIADWAGTDPKGALEFAASLEEGRLRNEACAEALAKWAEKDTTAAIAAARDLAPMLKAGVSGNRALNELVAIIAAKDPKTAVEFAASLPEGFRSNSTLGAAATWAASEPLAALQWCLENEVSVTRASQRNEPAIEASVLSRAIVAKPNETAEWIRQLPEGPERDRMAEYAVASLARSNQFGKEKPGARETEMMNLYGTLPPDAQERTALSVGTTLGSQSDVTDVEKILELFSPGAAQAMAIHGTIMSMYVRDPAMAEAAFATLSGPLRDEALSGMIKAMGFQKIPEAAARALEIKDASIQRETLQRIIPWWLKQDPDSSRAWLDQAKGLPPEWVRGWTNSAK